MRLKRFCVLAGRMGLSSLLSVFLDVSLVHAAALEPGVYLTEAGKGHLEIQRSSGKALPFRLFSLGPNGHTCDLEGAIEGDRATLRTTDAGSACIVVFSASFKSVRVRPVDDGPCLEFCGLNAGFAGTYVRPGERCTPKAKAVSRDRFAALYREGAYARAAAELEPILSECHRTLHWLEAAEIRNDLAITQYHRRRFDQCRQLLTPVLKDAEGGEGELRKVLAPADFDSFMPLAKAARANDKLCTAGANGRK